MNLTCPKDPNHKKFVARQKVTQEIECDSEGNYIAVYNDGDVISTDYEEATCSTCGADAVDAG
jgi:hypothetical protein